VAIAAACFSSALLAADNPLRRPPVVEAFDVKQLPHAEHLATPPVRTLLGYTRRVLRLPDGHTLAVFSYSNAAPANWMFLIDARDLSSKRVPIPHNDVASHAAALGSDGNIYVMPYHSPRAYRYDVGKSAFEPITVGGLPGGECTWDAIGGEGDGCIYFGTYPNACVGRYEIATGKTHVWPHAASRTIYVSNFSVDPAGGVRFKAWGPDEVWMHLGPSDAEPKRVEPPAPEPAATTRPGVAKGDVDAPEPSWTLRVDNAEITIGHYGSLQRRDLASGAVKRARLDNLSPGGNLIMFLEAVTPDCVLGANYSQQHLWCLNPFTGDVRVSEAMIARTTGQPNSAVALNGKAYVGTYIRAIVSEFDPAKPFAFRENPREVGELFMKLHQTRPAAAATDGRLVYFGSEADYSRLGGALAVFDPKTRAFDAYGDVVKDQNVTSLACDASNKLVWGGTNRWGEMRSSPPTQPSAVVFAFDAKTRKVVATVTPWPGADEVRVAGCTDDGMVIATWGGAVAVIDGASREVLFNGAWPVIPQNGIRHGADGQLYLLSGGTLLRWDVKRNVMTAVGQAPGACRFFTEPSPGVWLMADATSVYRLRASDAAEKR
jgi:hypothetical protein